MSLPRSPVERVPLASIDLDDRRFQIRMEERGGQLQASIEREGQLVPVVLQRARSRFRVIDGFRRCGILRRIDAPHVLATSLAVSDDEALRLAFVFNHERKTLKPEDRWNSLRMLAERGWSDTRIGEALGLHRATIVRWRQLFPTSRAVRRGVEEGWLRPSHLRALRDLVPEAAWSDWLPRIRDEDLSGRRLYRVIEASRRRREPPYVAFRDDGTFVARGFKFDPVAANADEMWRATEQLDRALDQIRAWLRKQGRPPAPPG